MMNVYKLISRSEVKTYTRLFFDPSYTEDKKVIEYFDRYELVDDSLIYYKLIVYMTTEGAEVNIYKVINNEEHLLYTRDIKYKVVEEILYEYSMILSIITNKYYDLTNLVSDNSMKFLINNNNKIYASRIFSSVFIDDYIKCNSNFIDTIDYKRTANKRCLIEVPIDFEGLIIRECNIDNIKAKAIFKIKSGKTKLIKSYLYTEETDFYDPERDMDEELNKYEETFH